MAEKDDALILRPGRRSKGPTAEELNRHIPQKRWLDANINWGRLRKIAYTKMRDPVITDELVQDVYDDMGLWTLEELQGLRNPKGYACIAVRNRILRWKQDQFRTIDQFRSVQLQDDYENIPARELSMEQTLENQQQVHLLLSSLPKEWREPWLLRNYYGYTHEKTAQHLHLTVDAVKKRVRRADIYLNMLATTPDEPTILDRVRNVFKRKGHDDEQQ